MLRILFLTGFLLLAWLSVRRRHWVRAFLWAVCGIWLTRYFQPVSDWLQTLGEDSLAEAQKFAMAEAGFFLETLNATLIPMHWDRVAVLVAIAAALVLALTWGFRWLAGRLNRPGLLRKERACLSLAGAVFIVVPLAWQVGEIAPQFRSNSDIYANANKHFAHQAERLQLVPDGASAMRVVVYIGESTTNMHWSLYGYPLNTTPKLQAFAREHPGFLRFSNVVSTHTLTSQSLLEALSIGMPGGSDYLPITERPRGSLVDVLKRLDVPTFLMSTQGNTGVWNLASSIVFSKVDRSVYASATSALGQSAAQSAKERVWDHEFFSDAVQKFHEFRPEGPAVAFLHSYAGHGVYTEYIPPEARHTGEAFFEGIGSPLIYGEGLGLAADQAGFMAGAQQRIKGLLNSAKGEPAAQTHTIADYDDAIRYIDGNLAHVLGDVAQASQPTVFLYFSDHGESPGTGLGHDSSRMQHEMLRVPFLMYFNPAAQRANPALFASFQKAAQAGKAATLAQVPATVLALLGYHVQGGLHDYRGMGLDADDTLVPVLVRKLADGISYVRTHGLEREQRSDARDHTDPATTIWLNSKARSAQEHAPVLCYDDANTWAKANRGAIVADCLAARLAVKGDLIDVAPLVESARGWGLEALARMAAGRKLPLWLDGGTQAADNVCTGLEAWIRKAAPRPRPLMLLLAPVWDESMSASCARLREQGVDIYVRLPAEAAGDATHARDWSRASSLAGWPARYATPWRPDTAGLKELLAAPDVKWALTDVSVEQLPWRGTSSLPAPDVVLVDTAWDPNSRR